jgi:hypothetical protein
MSSSESAFACRQLPAESLIQNKLAQSSSSGGGNGGGVDIIHSCQ